MPGTCHNCCVVGKALREFHSEICEPGDKSWRCDTLMQVARQSFVSAFSCSGHLKQAASSKQQASICHKLPDRLHAKSDPRYYHELQSHALFVGRHMQSEAGRDEQLAASRTEVLVPKHREVPQALVAKFDWGTLSWKSATATVQPPLQVTQDAAPAPADFSYSALVSALNNQCEQRLGAEIKAARARERQSRVIYLTSVGLNPAGEVAWEPWMEQAIECFVVGGVRIPESVNRPAPSHYGIEQESAKPDGYNVNPERVRLNMFGTDLRRYLDPTIESPYPTLVALHYVIQAERKEKEKSSAACREFYKGYDRLFPQAVDLAKSEDVFWKNYKAFWDAYMEDLNRMIQESMAQSGFDSRTAAPGYYGGVVSPAIPKERFYPLCDSALRMTAAGRWRTQLEKDLNQMIATLGSEQVPIPLKFDPKTQLVSGYNTVMYGSFLQRWTNAVALFDSDEYGLLMGDKKRIWEVASDRRAQCQDFIQGRRQTNTNAQVRELVLPPAQAMQEEVQRILERVGIGLRRVMPEDPSDSDLIQAQESFRSARENQTPQLIMDKTKEAFSGTEGLPVSDCHDFALKCSSHALAYAASTLDPAIFDRMERAVEARIQMLKNRIKETEALCQSLATEWIPAVAAIQEKELRGAGAALDEQKKSTPAGAEPATERK